MFIGNSTRPTKEQRQDRSPIVCGSVSRPWLELAIARGFDVYLGINRDDPEELGVDLPVRLYDSCTYRNPFDLRSNARAIRNLLAIVREGDVEVIHCNSPVGGLVGRVVGALGRVPVVIYTAHGFHFYRGAPLVNRTLYKAAEILLALKTDAIITMNEEDRISAEHLPLRRAESVYKISGVGVDVEGIQSAQPDREGFRKELGIADASTVAISVGDLVPRKNHGLAISSLAAMTSGECHLVICGDGPERGRLARLARDLGISSRVHFLGRRGDVVDLLRASDFFVHLSNQEGLPRAVMEAMAAGLPLVLSNVRGNIDLVNGGAQAFSVSNTDTHGISLAMDKLTENPALRSEMARGNEIAAWSFDTSVVSREASAVYECILGN